MISVQANKKIKKFLKEQLGLKGEQLKEELEIRKSFTKVIVLQGPTATVFDASGNNICYIDIDTWREEDYRKLIFEEE